MANVVEIIIKTKDESAAGFSSFDQKLKAIETRSDSSIGRIRDKLKNSGKESGEGFADNVGKGLERGLAKAEAQLAASKARMDKAIALGAGDKARASIEYDIKLHEASVTKAKEDIERHGRDMSKRLGDGIDNNTFRSRMTSTFSKLGEGVAKTFTNESGKLISEGFGESVKSVLTSPAVLGIGAGLAAILIPAIGAALSAGVMLGLGGGVLAAGVMAAVKAPGVQAAFDTFKTKASDAFNSFGKAFQGPVARAMQTFGDMVDRLSPAFNRIGAAAAPIIDKLAPALAGMAERAMPGIEYAMNNMGPVFDALASILPQLGDDIGRFFATISDQGPGAIAFIKDFGKFLGKTLEIAGDSIAALTWVYGKMRGVDDSAKDAGKSVGKMGEDFSKGAQKTKTLAETVEDLTQKMLAAAGGTLSLRAATRAYEGAIDKLADAVKHGARGIDEHTEKGRENAAMLDAVASGARGAAEAARRMGQSNEQVTRIMERGATQYTRQAMSLGLNRKAALDLTASIFGIPAAKKTALEMLGVAKSKRELADIRAAIYALDNRAVYIDVVTRYSHKGTGSANAQQAYRSGGVGSTAASGGVRAGQVLVGEDGPEIIDMNRTIYNAGKTRQMLAANNGNGGQGDTHIHIGKLELPNVKDLENVVQVLQRWCRDNGPLPLKGGVRTI